MNTKEKETTKYPEDCYISVIGKDGKRHVALSWKDEATCGMPIKIKNPNDEQCTNLYSCYHCTY